MTGIAGLTRATVAGRHCVVARGARDRDCTYSLLLHVLAVIFASFSAGID
ncbi:MAG: hypothetical protein ACSLFC_04940 [Desulfuromonadales bacterium]